MKADRLAVVVCLILAAATSVPALAQQPATAPAAGVLKQIPAGTLGYVVVNDLKGSSAAIQQLLTDMGMNAMVKPAIGDDMLATAIKALQLGEGLDTTGGVAVALMDGKELSIDLDKTIYKLMDRRSSEEQFFELPLLMIVPGKDIKSVFGKYKCTVPEGEGFTNIQIPGAGVEVFAAERGGYIFLSPTAETLTAALAAKKSAADELDKDHAAMIGRSIAAIHVDLARCAPIINGHIKKAQESLNESIKRYQTQTIEGVPESVKRRVIADEQGLLEALGVAKGLYAQLGLLSAGVRTVKGGVVADTLLTFADGSVAAKEVQAAKALDKPLGLLPALDYGLAMSTKNSPLAVSPTIGMTMWAGGLLSMGGSSSVFPRSMNAEITRMMLKYVGTSMSYQDGEMVAGIPEKLTAMADQYEDEVLTTHVFAGAAPEKNGILGATIIMECKDAAKLKTILAGTCATISEIVDKPSKGQFKLEYKKAAAEGEPDIIDAVSTDLSRMPESGHKTMTAIVGDDKVNIMVGAAGKNIVVLTFGGKRAMFDAAMKSAADGGPIAKDKEIVKGMEYMPKNLQALQAINGGQIFDLVMASLRAGGDNSAPPFSITAKTPLMIGVGATGSSDHIAVFMPADLLRDAVNMFMAVSQSGVGFESRQAEKPATVTVPQREVEAEDVIVPVQRVRK